VLELGWPVGLTIGIDLGTGRVSRPVRLPVLVVPLLGLSVPLPGLLTPVPKAGSLVGEGEPKRLVGDQPADMRE
jgi:hypothetical protein